MEENSEKPQITVLPPLMERAAQLIASGVSQANTANHHEVRKSKNTINRWTHDEKFQKRVEELRTDDSVEAQDILSGGEKAAAEVIVGTVKGNVGDLKTAKLRFDAAKYLMELLKPKKIPLATKHTRETRAREFSDAEVAEMMEPVEEDES